MRDLEIMESEMEDLKKSICDILEDNVYMCSQCVEKSNRLLKDASGIDKNTVVKVNNDVEKLLNRMTINLTDFIERFNKAVEDYHREADKVTPEPISQAKKKVNLSLNRASDDEDTDLEDPPLFSNEEAARKEPEKSDKDAQEEDGCDSDSGGETIPLGNFEVQENADLVKEGLEDTLSQSNSEIIKSNQNSENEDIVSSPEHGMESREDIDNDNQQLLSLLSEKDPCEIPDRYITSAEADAALESLSTKSEDDSFDKPDTDIDASISDGESDDSLSLSSSSSILNTSRKIRCLPSSSEDSAEEERPCTKNIEISIRRVDELSDQEIDRLCDLNSLNKRKCSSVLKRSRKKKLKRIRLMSSSSSESFSSGCTTPDLADITMEESLNPIFDVDKQNQMFTDHILDNLDNESQSDMEIVDATKKSTKTAKSADSASEDAKSEGASKGGDTSISTTQLCLSDLESSDDDVIEVKQVSKDSKWKNDPLLRYKLSSSDSDSDKEDRKVDPEKAKKRRHRLLNTNEPIIIVEDDSSRDSSSTDDLADIEFLTKYGRDDDSDVEFIDDAENLKGRKDLRPIMPDECLSEATQRAKTDEEARIQRLEEYEKNLQSVQSQHVEFVLDVNLQTNRPLVVVDQHLADKLKPHQRDGVKFMWEACFESVEMIKKGHKGSGCVLAHCMGLGKTLQVITLIHTLFENKDTKTKHVLVICPLSTVTNWKNEFKSAIDLIGMKPCFKLYFIVGVQNEQRCDVIERWYKNGGVTVMGYEAYTILTSDKVGAKVSPEIKENLIKALADPGPDLIVCDEGHLIKNDKTLRSQALMKVKTQRRIILTGTPLQNNLMEYYHMVKFIKPNLLGTKEEYINRFRDPIMNGQFYDSTEGDKILMKKRTHCLNKLLKKTVHRVESKVLEEYLPPIVDYTISIKLSASQIQMYKRLIDLVKCPVDHARCAFFYHYQLTKYISLHPYVLHYYFTEYNNKQKNKNKKQKEIIVHNNDNNIESDENAKDAILPKNWYLDLYPIDAHFNINYGPKLKIVMDIIDEAIKFGDKTLLFSSSLVEFNVIEHFLTNFGTKSCQQWTSGVDYYRLDGNVKPNNRQEMCNKFNDPNNKDVKMFMVSHMVGGLGLNLTAANRVILISANFNPCYDTQSIYRAYRFGQTKTCYVYRLLSAGTMESTIYEKCVIKLAVAGTVVDKFHFTRHYSSRNRDEYYKYNFDVFKDRPELPQPSDYLLSNLIIINEDIYKFHEHRALLKHRPEEELDEAEKKVAEDEFDKEIRQGRLRNYNLPMGQPQPTNTNSTLPSSSNQHVFRPPVATSEFERTQARPNTSSASNQVFSPPPSPVTTNEFHRTHANLPKIIPSNHPMYNRPRQQNPPVRLTSPPVTKNEFQRTHANLPKVIPSNRPMYNRPRQQNPPVRLTQPPVTTHENIPKVIPSNRPMYNRPRQQNPPVRLAAPAASQPSSSYSVNNNMPSRTVIQSPARPFTPRPSYNNRFARPVTPAPRIPDPNARAQRFAMNRGGHVNNTQRPQNLGNQPNTPSSQSGGGNFNNSINRGIDRSISDYYRQYGNERET